MKIGVLALQGDFVEHLRMLEGIGVQGVEVRLPGDMEGLDGLIVPGGESTTIGKLAASCHLIDPIRRLAATKPIWGTCAGAIFLAKTIQLRQAILGLMDITVLPNAFGRQVDSFEINLDVPALKIFGNGRPYPFHAVFIRAPLIVSVEGDVEVLTKLPDGRIVAARQRNLLVTSFHPELTGDDRFHRYFLGMGR